MNGTIMQILFVVAKIVRYLSQSMVIDPGDIINPGTPPGVASATPGPPCLPVGGVMELGVTGLGRQRLVAAQ